MSRVSNRSIAIAILLFTVGILTIFITRIHERDENIAQQQQRYNLLSKRIFQENPNDVIVNFIPLRQVVKQYMEKTGLEHSLFFEYLPTGTSIRSNENNQLAGASLLKLPTIISLYKASEEGSIELDEEVTIKEEWVDKAFGNLWREGAGYKITLREAARSALVDSDNTAIKTIRGVLGDKIEDNESVLSQLDVDFPYTIDGQSQVSARDYSAVLRCLYLSCYLSKENSQEILRQLTEAPHFERLAKPLPDDIKVAHKIGVFQSEVQSDCGIVYRPNRPYMLCIIIKAPSDVADRHMQTISSLIYEYINDEERAR